jgi:hypothetical protein
LQDYILVDAYDSTKGPYMPGGIGGGVGADGCYNATSNSTPPGAGIFGDLWASCPGGINDSSDEYIAHDVRSGGPLSSSATMTIGNDAYANGSVTGGVNIGGKLYAPTGANVGVMPKGGVVRGPVSFPPPCDCQPNQIVPINAMVMAHASPNNDDATIGLNPNVMASPGAPTRLDLPCGSYYLTAIRPQVPVTIWAHGHTALYIGGDVTSADDITFGVDPTGTFDIFIAGTLSTQGRLTIGSPNYPALMRVYIGGTAGVTFSSDAIVAANIYVPNGPVTWSAGTDAFGSVFAHNFTATAAVRIHYDTAVLGQGTNCPMMGGPPPPPPPTDGGSSSGTSNDGGSSGASSGSGSSGTGASGTSSSGTSTSEGGPPPACMSCRDCLNQACTNGMCGSCATSLDCCAPLVCNNGTCQTVLIR